MIRPTAYMPIEDIKRHATCWTENQQITYDYAIGTVLPLLKEGGVWIAPMPRTPLTFIELIECFLAIREHPAYGRQTMTLNDRDGQPVTYLPNGLVQVGMGEPNV